MTSDFENDPADIRAWQRLGPDLTTSGRLQAQDPDRLQAIGVSQVINLALDDHPEALADEGRLLEARGIGYTHIPIPFDDPKDHHFQLFRQALEQARGSGDRPVHVHCIMNWRVSAFFYRLHREDGMARDAALRLLRQQWDPFASADPRARVWAELIEIEAENSE